MASGTKKMPEPLGLYAGQLFERGSEYFQAFRMLSTHQRESTHASYFMLAHAAELFLKSYLAANQVTKSELRSGNFGHKLDVIYQRCVELSLPCVDELAGFVFQINEMNADYDFRYPMNYNLRVPNVELCLKVMIPLQQVLKPIIENARLHAQIHWAAETRHLKGYKIRWSD